MFRRLCNLHDATTTKRLKKMFHDSRCTPSNCLNLKHIMFLYLVKKKNIYIIFENFSEVQFTFPVSQLKHR